MSLSRGIIFFGKYPIRFKTLFTHALVWALVIPYEIILAGAIRESYDHYLVYALHYPLYILLFYGHCRWVFEPAFKRKRRNLSIFFFGTAVAWVIFTSCTLGIAFFLKNQGLKPGWEFEPYKFILANIYRFVHVAAASYAYWSGRNMVRKVKHLYRRRMADIISSRDRLLAQVRHLKNEEPAQNPYVFVKDNEKNELVKVNLQEITHAKADGNYLWIHTVKRAIRTYLTLKEFHKMVEDGAFSRINKSHLINIDQIERFSGNMIFLTNGTLLEVKPAYRETFEEKIAKKLLVTERNAAPA